MDGESFDRLSKAVHRLRDQASRRNALRLLLGGSVVAVTGLAGDDAEARRKKHKNKHRNKNKGRKNCRVGAIRCRRNRDCCFGKCRNGFCFGDGGGGGGGGRCNGQRCPSGWRCCSFQGRRQCLPRDHVFCGGDGVCPFDWERCGNGCCSPGTHCCHDNDFCLNDMFDCDDFFDVNAVQAQGNQTSEPIPFDEIDPKEFE